MSTEHSDSNPVPRGEPEPGFPERLPPELVAAIRDQEYACVTVSTNLGTAFVAKVPERQLQTIGGTVPISIRHELYQHPRAPVIRTLIVIYDQPSTPLALETFINVADQGQRQDFAALAEQRSFHMFFYDEELWHRVSKHVTHSHWGGASQVLRRADELLASVPGHLLDFDAAKAEVLRRVEWPPH